MYQAHKEGRNPNDPTLNWYDGEIRFLDGYVIPLARKLGDCGVFGVSGDEYLSTYNLHRCDSSLDQLSTTYTHNRFSIFLLVQLQNTPKPIVKNGRKRDKKWCLNGLANCKVKTRTTTGSNSRSS